MATPNNPQSPGQGKQQQPGYNPEETKPEPMIEEGQEEEEEEEEEDQ